jgi:CRP-like cAMP-binding protein
MSSSETRRFLVGATPGRAAEPERSTSEKVTLLQRIDLFVAMPTALLTELAERVDEVIYPANTLIFAQGDEGDAMYIVAAGEVRIHSGGRTLTILEAPQVFGEMAALVPDRRSADATALAAGTRLLRLERAALQALIATHGTVANGLIQILCQRLRERTTTMVDDHHYLQQVARLTAAAAAVESGIYTPETIAEVTQRNDALGQLARVFQGMIREVYAREQRLQQQVQELRIEVDKARQTQQVAKITGSDYFQQLRGRANELREQLGGSGEIDDPAV